MATRRDVEFRAFHLSNPEIYDALVRLARQAKTSGMRRCGIRMLWEVARWELALSSSDPDFALPNNMHSRYARLLMVMEPDLAGFFATAKLRS